MRMCGRGRYRIAQRISTLSKCLEQKRLSAYQSHIANHASALDRARRKAYWRLLPLLFVCYVIAYLLEIPGSVLVEKWSARKLLCRIMITWGIAAGLTAFVKTPMQFFAMRFLLGLAEAGFFPGVIVYLTHWFPQRDRSRAISLFLIATPVAQIVSPKISNALLRIGTNQQVNGGFIHYPGLFGFKGWQWVYIYWGVPAVLLGVIVLFLLSDRPRNATWLSPEEREALDQQLEAEKAQRAGRRRMRLGQAFRHPKVLLLAAAYFCSTSANYGLEFFLPSILQRWHALELDAITWLVILPPCLALASQLFVGWNADRTGERRLHAVIPIFLAVIGLGLAPITRGHLPLTIGCFMLAFAGIKAYQPAFWSLPSLFLTDVAAAGSIGLINSIGNLGGFLGPTMLGGVEKSTGSFVGGIYYLGFSLLICGMIITWVGLGRREGADRGNSKL
jgi:ACS family tartrate transporter-like MFS transporter